MWRSQPVSLSKGEGGDTYTMGIRPGHPNHRPRSVQECGFTESVKSLGRDFNPLKFDFAPMREFNPLKFRFDMVETTDASDLMDVLPECLGPVRHTMSPEMGATSHQDVSLSHHLHESDPMTGRSGPTLDEDTLSLLDSLGGTFRDGEPDVMSQTVEDVLRQRKKYQHAKARMAPMTLNAFESPTVFDNRTNVPENHEKHQCMSQEELRVMRNKAVQKRYRIRKKTQAKCQQNMFGATKADLAIAESKAPAHHITVVDKLLRLRRLDGERDAEINRLRKMLAQEKASTDVGQRQVMVIDDKPVAEGDFCDSNIEVVLPKNIVVAVMSDACCERMAATLLKDQTVAEVVSERFAAAYSTRIAAI